MFDFFLYLPTEIILHICKYLLASDLLALSQTCSRFKNIINDCDKFWEKLCKDEDLINWSNLQSDDDSKEICGFNGIPLRLSLEDETWSKHKKIYKRGLKMKKNIINSNYRGYRIYANESLPISQILADSDIFEIKKSLGDYPILDDKDNIVVEWNEQYLVVFKIFNSNENGDATKIWVYDIKQNPKILYMIDKGNDYVINKMVVFEDYIIGIPSWPLSAQAIVLTWSIKNEMNVIGKYLFENQEEQTKINTFWRYTMLNVIKYLKQGVVIYSFPEWNCLIVDLPSCTPLKHLNLDFINPDSDCLQFRNYMSTVTLIMCLDDELFNLIVLNIDGVKSKVKVYTDCPYVKSVAIYPNENFIYLLEEKGNIYRYNATIFKLNLVVENIWYTQINEFLPNPIYEMFISSRQDLCLLQNKADAKIGRFVKVFNSDGQEVYHINLDLWKFGLSCNKSIYFYANNDFLIIANPTKILLFYIKTGKYVGYLSILNHPENSKGKEFKSYDTSHLEAVCFDEYRLILIHNYEFKFPSIIDLYYFW